MDLNIFYFINHLAGRSALLDFGGIFLADYLAYLLIAALAVLFFLPGPRRLANQVMILMAGGAGVAARFLVKPLIILFYPRPRPFVVMPAVHKLIFIPASEYWQSFPSGHALFFFALTTVILFYNKKIGYWFLAASILMGLARIFAGVHYPSDILAGAVIGALTAWAIQAIYAKYWGISKKVG